MSLPLLAHLPWLPSTLPTKLDLLYLAFKSPPTVPQKGLLIRDSNPAQILPNSKSLHLASPLPACMSHRLARMPFPLLGLAKVLCRVRGWREAVSWWGTKGPQPSPASAGPLPSFPGSSLGPKWPHVPWLAQFPLPLLQPVSSTRLQASPDTFFTHSCLPASLHERVDVDSGLFLRDQGCSYPMVSCLNWYSHLCLGP